MDVERNLIINKTNLIAHAMYDNKKDDNKIKTWLLSISIILSKKMQTGYKVKNTVATSANLISVGNSTSIASEANVIETV